MREYLEGRQVRTLRWIDTRDMVSDGLNKGSVDRSAITRLFSEGIWETKHECKAFSFEPKNP